jgi:hypothetical protein
VSLGDGAISIALSAVGGSITLVDALLEKHSVVRFVIGGRVGDAVPVDCMDKLTDALVGLLQLPVYFDLCLARAAFNGGVSSIDATASAYLLPEVSSTGRTVCCECLFWLVLVLLFLLCPVLRKGYAGVETSTACILAKKPGQVLWILFVITEVVIGFGNRGRVGAGGGGTSLVAKEFVLDLSDKRPVSGPICSKQKCHGKIPLGSGVDRSSMFSFRWVVDVSGCSSDNFGHTAWMGINGGVVFFGDVNH